MPRLWYLGEDARAFPPTANALAEPNGLLAVGGDLSPERLLCAYQRGIFPWYEQGQPILWWTPDPRTVVAPERVHCSHSLAKFLRKSRWTVTIDCAFDSVVRGCAGQRAKSLGTWITPQMRQAYTHLHKLGFAHSAEVLDEQRQLVGGIYGVALGRIFFGESMFSQRSNASKTAFVLLARWLALQGFELIDCQVANPHLSSLGAYEIDRNEFERLLSENTSTLQIESMQAAWQQARGKTIARDGRLIS